MLTLFFRTVVLYIVVIFVIRLMGKRQIGELGPAELVITILISNIATLPIEEQDIPLIVGIVPILTLACFDVFMSWFTLKSSKLRKFIDGNPKVVIQNGKPDKKVLNELRFSEDELLMAVRAKDIKSISDVELAIVETNGTVSVFEKKKGGKSK
jgi:uncharacterized membrane protein YcaP (DUF421 family)